MSDEKSPPAEEVGAAAPEPAEVAARLPHRPGVYRMIDATGSVLYVGKALDLRKRVGSYFQNRAGLSPRIRLMLGQVATLETTVTRSEAEALLLENNLIKALAPRYNILFRDDKSYPYITLTGHRFARLAFHRGALDPQNRYFGPFPSAGAVRESLQLLQRVFRLRTCQESVFNNRSRPCLLHQIRRCTAPCVGLVSEADYAEDVRNAELFLHGRDSEVLEGLATRMQACAQAQAYEHAAVYRDQIQALRKVRERQYVDRSSGADADVVATATAAGVVAVNLAMIRGGRHLGDRPFFPRNAEESPAANVLEAFLVQHYLEHPAPPAIIVNASVDAATIERALTDRSGHAVVVMDSVRGERRAWLEMAEQNARLAAEQHAALHATQEVRGQALAEALGAAEALARIECFDVSHTMGEATVASCVVYEAGAMKNADYRRFNIATAAGGDDYGAMREVITRRYRRVVDENTALPDLILIDGGRGQLAVAAEVLGDLGLGDLLLVGVAKGEERKPGLEQLWVRGREAPIVLAPTHPGLHLIQQIRDEAHRFAIQGHRARRGKARTTSTLDDVVGIGAKRRQRLVVRFGGLKGLVAASVDELARVEGISRELAERIYRHLH